MVQFVVAGEKIVAQGEIQLQPPTYLPIVLQESTYLPVPPVPDIAFQVGGPIFGKPWIDAGNLVVRCVRRKEQRVEKGIGRPPRIDTAVLDIAPHFRTYPHVVLTMVDRNHVGVGVDVLVKSLGISQVRTETQSAVVENNAGHAGDVGCDIASYPREPCPELIEHGGAESMNVAELKIGCCHLRKIQEAAQAEEAGVVLVP